MIPRRGALTSFQLAAVFHRRCKQRLDLAVMRTPNCMQNCVALLSEIHIEDRSIAVVASESTLVASARFRIGIKINAQTL